MLFFAQSPRFDLRGENRQVALSVSSSPPSVNSHLRTAFTPGCVAKHASFNQDVSAKDFSAASSDTTPKASCGGCGERLLTVDLRFYSSAQLSVGARCDEMPFVFPRCFYYSVGCMLPHMPLKSPE